MFSTNVENRPPIQRVDDPSNWSNWLGREGAAPLFADDEDALEFVRRRAAEGSDLHQRALAKAVASRLTA